MSRRLLQDCTCPYYGRLCPCPNCSSYRKVSELAVRGMWLRRGRRVPFEEIGRFLQEASRVLDART
jgi:hypothetical protein